MTDYLARLFYLGDLYYGSQYQLGFDTVQGKLIDAFNSWTGETHSPQTVQLSGRTDLGVHSIGQLVMVTTSKRIDVDKINKHLPEDIQLWASVKAPVDFSQVTDIVFAADFIEAEDNVAAKLKILQNLLDAKLHLVKVDTPGNFENSRTIKKRIHSFVQKHGLENYTMEIYNESTEEDGIIYFSEDIDADMIALATHGRTGLKHLLSGSIAEDVVNHAQRPVWTCGVHK